jgi:hypothetical protein
MSVPMNTGETPRYTVATGAMPTERPLDQVLLLVEAENGAEIEALVEAAAS